MARFNEIMVGHFNRGLQKLTGIKGPVPSPQLASEIMPVLQLPLGPEFLYLVSWHRFAFSISLGAVAAQNGQARLRNPKGSNVVAVIEYVSLQTSTLSAVATFGPNTTDDTNIAPAYARFDSRGNPSPVCIFSSGSSAGVVPASTQQILTQNFQPSNTHIFIGLGGAPEIQLLPGDMLYLQDATVNEGFAVNIWWRERFLEESERT